MKKKIWIFLSSALFLCAAENDNNFPNISGNQNQSNKILERTKTDAGIARNKSRFFIGGVLGSVSFSQNVSISGSSEVTNATPGNIIGNFNCQKMPDGSTRCLGTGGAGITTGYATSSRETISKIYQNSESSMSYGGRFGYNYFFTPRNGLRFIAALQRTNLKITPHKYSLFEDSIHRPYYIASVGVDYLLDFTKGRSPFGIFFGGGYDYNFGEAFSKIKEQDKAIKNPSGGYINFGISQTIAQRVRIDVGYKMLFYKYFDTSYQVDSAKQIASNQYEEAHIKGQDKLSSGIFYAALDILF